MRISQADLPGATADTRRLGLAVVLAAELKVRLSRRLSLVPGAQLFLDVVPPVRRVPGGGRLQDFERLGLHVQLGASTELVVDLQTAIGGQLAGSTVAGGLRLTANLR